MPSPMIRYRLPKPKHTHLKRLARLCGYPSPDLFARDLMLAGISGEPPQTNPVFVKLWSALMDQRQGQLGLAVDGSQIVLKAKGRLG